MTRLSPSFWWYYLGTRIWKVLPMGWPLQKWSFQSHRSWKKDSAYNPFADRMDCFRSHSTLNCSYWYPSSSQSLEEENPWRVNFKAILKLIGYRDIKEAYKRKGRKPPVKNERKFFTTRAYLADKVFKLILLPAIVLAIFISQRENKWFGNVQLSECGDDITNSYFQTYTQKLNGIDIYYFLVLNWIRNLLNIYCFTLHLACITNPGLLVRTIHALQDKGWIRQVLRVKDPQRWREDCHYLWRWA